MKKGLMLALILMLGLTGAIPAAGAEAAAEKPLWVGKVEDLPADFIFGMDASSVIAEEESGVRYYNFDGEEQDVFQTLAESGVTHIRVRVWNNPYDGQGRGFGGGNSDLDKAAAIGKRAAQYGLPLIVDFHYSDFWADPGKQMVPRAWAGMKLEEKAEAVYAYTAESLETLKAAGAIVGMVQLGNETNGALCGERTWPAIAALMRAGGRAVRACCPDAPIAVHFANPERPGAYADYAKQLRDNEVDYDVFASSYYPFWHGTLDNLARVLGEISEGYGKKVMVMETSYAYTLEDTDFAGNTVSADASGLTLSYPCTVQGQANEIRDVIDTVAHIPGGIGVAYWEGAWISVGGKTWEENNALWEKHGSGWASRFAAVYDPDDAGKYYGGCAVDNQALFDEKGRPLPSLRVFGLVREGSDAPVVPDAAADVRLTVIRNDPVTLPETVEAVMSDNSRRAIPAVWNATAEELGKISAGGEGVYEINGTAEGLPVVCRINVTARNLLTNGGFEDGDAGWTAVNIGKTKELFVEDKVSDSLTGTKHFHFWSPDKNSVEFRLEQTVENVPAGTYRFSVSIMGGDAGESEIYAYVLLDGRQIGSAPLKITSYGAWDTAAVEPVAAAEGQTVTVGVYVKCAGAGGGAWGKIDDAELVVAP